MKSKIIRIIADDDFSVKSLLNKTHEEIKSISSKNEIKLNKSFQHICEFIGSFNEKGKLVSINFNSVSIHTPYNTTE